MKLVSYPRLEPSPLPDVAAEDEGLTGYVHGLEASDLEERFARALDNYALDYQFQFFVDTAHTLPGEAKQVDFMVEERKPWEVDGEFSHKTAEQHEYDRERDDQIDGALRERGYEPVQRVTFESLVDQDHADGFVEMNIA